MSIDKIEKFIAPLELEFKRDLYAKSNNLIEFRRLYSVKYPEISDNNTSHLWDKLNLESCFTLKENPMAWHRTHLVADFLNNKVGKLLNIGFGPANLEELVLKSNTRLVWTGIDISEDSVKRANIKFKNKASFKTGSIAQIKIQEKEYDFVISLEVLEHIRPSLLFKVLSNIHNMLKNNGLFIVSVPLNENLDAMLKRNQNPNAHVRLYTPEILKTELLISKFKILKTKQLYAFKNLYFLKSILACIMPKIKKPNNIIVIAQKI